MKRKSGTTIDATLYEQTKDVARRQGRGVNDVIGEALARYVASSGPRPSIVEQTKGSFRVSAKGFRAILEEDLYGVD